MGFKNRKTSPYSFDKGKKQHIDTFPDGILA